MPLPAASSINVDAAAHPQCIPLTGKAGASWTRTRKIASRPKGGSPLLALGSATNGGRPAGEAQSPQQRGQSGREWAVRGSQEEDAESWDQLGCLKPSLARCSDHPSSNLVRTQDVEEAGYSPECSTSDSSGFHLWVHKWGQISLVHETF